METLLKINDCEIRGHLALEILLKKLMSKRTFWKEILLKLVIKRASYFGKHSYNI